MNPKTEEFAEKLRELAFRALLRTETQTMLIDAADCLEAMEAELSRLKAQQRWIPVTERLPEDDDDVLIMSSGSISMGYYSVYNEYWADYINVYNSDVTHWMRLPKEPKEDANENAQG